MGMPIVIMSSGGLPVTESGNGFGMRGEVATNGFGVGVTIVSSGGAPIIFYGPDGSLWPGGVAPGGGGSESLDFSDENNSQYIPII